MQLCSVAQYQTTLKRIAIMHRILNHITNLSTVNTHDLILRTDNWLSHWCTVSKTHVKYAISQITISIDTSHN